MKVGGQTNNNNNNNNNNINNNNNVSLTAAKQSVGPANIHQLNLARLVAGKIIYCALW